MTTTIDHERRLFHIRGMDCASCARTIESSVRTLPGITSCELNFTAERLQLSGDVSDDVVLKTIEKLGYEASLVNLSEDPTIPTEPSSGFISYIWQRSDTRLAILASFLILPGLLFHELLPMLEIHHPLIDVAAVTAMVLAGYPVFRRAWLALRTSRAVTMDLLMSIGAVGAVVIGAYTEAGVIMVLFVIGEAAEGYTAAKARSSIGRMAALVPSTATRIAAQGNVQDVEEVAVKALRIGDIILVRPGERIPMDGRVIAGDSAVDQAPITGESKPVVKGPDDNVFASSVNIDGALEIDVTHLAEDNTISRMIRLVEEAQWNRAPTQRFIDRFASYYTPAVVGLALLVAALPPLLLGQPLFSDGDPTQGWFYRALTLLVIACPCALVISTPVSIVSAISNGARHGVLFKGGSHLETLSRVEAIAFDKTGTLTTGRQEVLKVQSVACTTTGSQSCGPCDDVLALASSLESRSAHPLAQAIVAEASRRGLDQQYDLVQDVHVLAGRGVTGQVNDHEIVIGSHSYFDANIPHAEYCAQVSRVDTSGATTVLLSADGQYAGFIALADGVRGSSRTAIARLREQGFQHLLMITGDSEIVAHKIASEVGLDEIKANCLPEEKSSLITDLSQLYGAVAMVGDGINDAPALAAADVGIAVGNTAQAMDSADIVLTGESLASLPFATLLSQAAMRTIRINVALSLGLKAIFLVLVISGLGGLWMAVLADMGASLLVTAHGMRLLKRPKPQPSAGHQRHQLPSPAKSNSRQ